MIIPYDNKREIEELPAVVQKDVAFIPVKTIKEVFDVMFAHNNTKKKHPAKAKTVPVLHEDGAGDGVRCL